MPETDIFTEQLRREIAERMDVFLHDALRLSEKHAKGAEPGARLAAASALASGMAQQYAAEMLAARIDQLTAETAESSRNYLLASGRRKG
jgi:hypothetical protein